MLSTQNKRGLMFKHLIVISLLSISTMAFGQGSNPVNTYKIGDGATSTVDKGLIFDTGDGASNKKLLIEDTFKLKFDGNQLQIGDGALTADKSLMFNGTSGKAMKYDFSATEFNFNDDLKVTTGIMKLGNSTVKEVSNKLYFSENGGPDKRLGSGSGGGSGGVNILPNSGLEDGTTSWTNSGGTFTQETYTYPTDNNLKYGKFVATTAGQYVETSLTVTPSMVSGGCVGQFDKFATTDAASWKLSVLDSSGNYLNNTPVPATPTAALFFATQPAPFPCVAAGSTVKLRWESLAAGTINFDEGYLGSNRNTTQAICQGTIACEDIFSAKVDGIVSPSIVTDENLDFINGNCTRTGTGKYTCDFNPGIFTVTPNCWVTQANAPSTGNAAATLQAGATSSSVGISILSGDSTYSGPFNLICQKTGIDFNKAKPVTAVTPDQASWFVDVNIGGANASLGTASVASYTEITNAGLDMVVASGSSPAKIPCSATNAAGIGTCSAGNEGYGVVFTPPTPGYYEVCGQFSHDVQSATTGSIVSSTFQFVQTTPNTQTIIQEGRSRTNSKISSGGSSAYGSFPHNNCGMFYFSETSEKTIRLMYEQLVTGTATVSAIQGDRLGTEGQRDARIIVRPFLSAYNRLYLTGDQLTVSGSTKDVLISGKVSAAGVLSNQKGGGFSGCVVSGTSIYTCTFASTYADAPNCSFSNYGSGGLSNFVSVSSTQLVVRTANSANALSAVGWDWLCHATKQ